MKSCSNSFEHSRTINVHLPHIFALLQYKFLFPHPYIPLPHPYIPLPHLTYPLPHLYIPLPHPYRPLPHLTDALPHPYTPLPHLYKAFRTGFAGIFSSTCIPLRNILIILAKHLSFVLSYGYVHKRFDTSSTVFHHSKTSSAHKNIPRQQLV